LIPTQPNDGNFDSSDPITKYMNALWFIIIIYFIKIKNIIKYSLEI
jgi:hypothetical protein